MLLPMGNYGIDLIQTDLPDILHTIGKKPVPYKYPDREILFYILVVMFIRQIGLVKLAYVKSKSERISSEILY